MGRDPFAGFNPQAAGTARLLLKLLAEAGGSLSMRRLSRVKRMFGNVEFMVVIHLRP
jgi:hypothetical protein